MEDLIEEVIKLIIKIGFYHDCLIHTSGHKVFKLSNEAHYIFHINYKDNVIKFKMTKYISNKKNFHRTIIFNIWVRDIGEKNHIIKAIKKQFPNEFRTLNLIEILK